MDDTARDGYYDAAAALFDALGGRCRCGDSLEIWGGPSRGGVSSATPRTTKRDGGQLLGAVELVCASKTETGVAGFVRAVKGATSSHDGRVFGWFALA